MFILPPPPKYYANGGAHNLPVLEATNSHTTLDAEHNFTASEGLYTAQDCVFLATPLPHPSDPPPLVINPLAPTHNQPQTHSSGVRISYVGLKTPLPGIGVSASTMAGKYTLPALHYTASGESGGLPFASPTKTAQQQSFSSGKSFGRSSWTSSLRKLSTVSNNSVGGGSINNSAVSPVSPISPTNGSSALGYSDEDESTGTDEVGLNSTSPSGLSSLIRKESQNSAVTGARGDKKGKPKNSLVKNNSSFVSRTIVHEHFHKRIAERNSDDIFLWANVGRSLSWIDLSASAYEFKHEPLTKILFTKSHPLCHDVNYITRSSSNLELCIGTSSGDALWIEAISNRYNRINKNGDVTRSAITDIKWIPGSENLFITGHADGSLIIFDKERDDSGFSAQGLASITQDPRSTATFKIMRSLTSSAAVASRQNPVAAYKVSNGPLTALKFSPTGQFLVIAGNDGYLRLLDIGNEVMLDIFPSYYGGFMCAAFSPDGRYLATGGQDDMVAIWSMESRLLVARLQGHASWVRSVEFDPWNCDLDNYRLGSVGDDGKILFWDFTPKTLTKPKASVKAHHTSEVVAGNGKVEEIDDISLASTDAESKISNKKETLDLGIVHPFVSQTEVPIILPVMIKSVHVTNADPEPLCQIEFLERELIVSGKDGRIWTWLRPGTDNLSV